MQILQPENTGNKIIYSSSHLCIYGLRTHREKIKSVNYSQ